MGQALLQYLGLGLYRQIACLESQILIDQALVNEGVKNSVSDLILFFILELDHFSLLHLK